METCRGALEWKEAGTGISSMSTFRPVVRLNRWSPAGPPRNFQWSVSWLFVEALTALRLLLSRDTESKDHMLSLHDTCPKTVTLQLRDDRDSRAVFGTHCEGGPVVRPAPAKRL